jgi:hypothetical protein
MTTKILALSGSSRVESLNQRLLDVGCRGHQAFDQEGLLLDKKVTELVSAVGASLVRAATVSAMR